MVFTPIAQTSGLIRRSEEGPRLLNGAIIPVESIAPIAKTLSASAGAVIYFHSSFPSFPALTTTRIPFEAAMSAATEIRAVLPSISPYL